MGNKTEVKVEAYIRMTGRAEIVRKLAEWTGNNYRSMTEGEREQWDALFMGRELVNDKGKVAKRLRSSVKREHDYKLTPEQMSDIGNIANQNSTAGGSFIYELDNPDNMERGEFGDSGSCFYAEMSHHRHAMGDDGRFHVLKVYDESGDPISRAWTFEANDGAIIIFNAYGKLSRIKLASIMSTALQTSPSRKVRFNSDIYINGDEASAIGGDDEKEYYEVEINVRHYDQ